MKLIREEIETVQVLTESNNGKKTFYIQGPFLQGDVKNRNGRIYESAILAKEVKRYNEAYIDKNRAMGELGHPDGPTVNLDRVSHKIESLVQDGSNFIGKAKILETPMGRIAGALLNDGVTLGVSSRGMGSLPRGTALSTWVKTSCWLLLLTLLQIPALQMPLSKVLWKEKNGCGTTDS
jgi:hypothetical protein